MMTTRGGIALAQRRNGTDSSLHSNANHTFMLRPEGSLRGFPNGGFEASGRKIGSDGTCIVSGDSTWGNMPDGQ